MNGLFSQTVVGAETIGKEVLKRYFLGVTAAKFLYSKQSYQLLIQNTRHGTRFSWMCLIGVKTPHFSPWEGGDPFTCAPMDRNRVVTAFQANFAD